MYAGEKHAPKRVTSDSAASRNSVVEMPLSALIGTSAKDLLMVSNHVPSAGIAAIFVKEFK